MAVKGTYAAYAPLKGIEDNTSRNLRHADQVGFRNRREDQMRKERKQRRLGKLASQMGVDMSDLQFKESGVKSVDAPLYEYFSRTKGEVADLYKRIEQDPEDYDARILLEKKMNSAKTLAGFTQRYSQWQQDYKKGMAEGKYSKYLNKGVPEKVNDSLLQGRYKVLNDKNGELQLFVDMDGDGEMDEDFAAINVQEFMGGNELYAPAKATNRYEVQDAIADRFGTVETIEDEDGNYKRSEYKGFDPENTDALYKEVDGILGENLEGMTNEAKSILADDLGMDPESMSDEDFREFKNEFATGIINKFDKSTSETIDHSARIAQGNLNERRRGGGRGGNKDNSGGNTVEAITDEKGNMVFDETLGGYLYSFNGFPEVGNTKATRAVLSPQSGKVSFWVQIKGEDENGNEQVSEKHIFDTNEVADYIRNTPNPETGKKFKNQKEFSDFLQKSQHQDEGYDVIEEPRGSDEIPAGSITDLEDL